MRRDHIVVHKNALKLPCLGDCKYTHIIMEDSQKLSSDRYITCITKKYDDNHLWPRKIYFL